MTFDEIVATSFPEYSKLTLNQKKQLWNTIFLAYQKGKYDSQSTNHIKNEKQKKANPETKFSNHKNVDHEKVLDGA